MHKEELTPGTCKDRSVGTPETPDTEVEWQLDALDLRPVERWLAALPESAFPAGDPAGQSPELRQAPLTATPRHAERLMDSYLDTADWRIARSGYVLRVRHRGSRAEATIKDTAGSDDGLRRRLEVTEPLTDEGIEALDGHGPVGWRLRALVGRRPLETVVEVRTRRRPYDLRVGEDRVGELALDETMIVVEDDHQPVRLQRVEIEVDPAWVAPLMPVVDALRRQCGLRPATMTKFEAGLLASGQRIPTAPELGPTAVDRHATVGDVAFAVLRRHFSSMLAHEAGTRLGEDAEELHDMRVATRRMRAALSLFSDALPARARHVRAELGWLAEALGAVRDLDVQLEQLHHWRDTVAADDQGALDELARVLVMERADARRRLLVCLDSVRYERLVGGLTTMLRQGPSRRSVAARTPAAGAVPDLVLELHRKAVKAARRARRSGDPSDYHRTRIRGKRLRYALEFVSDVYDGQPAKYVRRVVKLQDVLGAMQDARVAEGRLHDLAREGPRLASATVFVMGGMAERYRHQSERMARKVPRLLHNLQGSEWKRLTAVMDRRRLELGALYRWPAPGGPLPGLRTAPSLATAPGSSSVGTVLGGATVSSGLGPADERSATTRTGAGAPGYADPPVFEPLAEDAPLDEQARPPVWTAGHAPEEEAPASRRYGSLPVSRNGETPGGDGS